MGGMLRHGTAKFSYAVQFIFSDGRSMVMWGGLPGADMARVIVTQMVQELTDIRDAEGYAPFMIED